MDPDKTLICGTRYGNVMASRGSVIPLFVEQIKSGQPITVTDPLMTRYIMSLDEAVELVEFAFQNAKAGDILVQKAPACNIGILATALKELFNATNHIKTIGIRHGEKAYEALLTKEEAVHAQDLGGYFRIPMDKRDLNYDKFFKEGVSKTMNAEEYTSQNTRQLTIEEVKEKLLQLDYIQSELKTWNRKDKE